MAGSCYKPCKELDACNALNKCWYTREYDEWFAGHLPLAEQGCPQMRRAAGQPVREKFGNTTLDLSHFARRRKRRQPQNMAYITSGLSVRK